MKPCLITGGEGQLGLALQKIAREAGLSYVAPKRDELDLMHDASILQQVNAQDWACIINGAAYTAVDKAESEPALAHRINGEAVGALARAAAARHIPLIQISTDYVFSGDADRPYRVEDVTGPINVYGASKLAGEEAARAAGGRCVIVRTSWVVSPWRQNFVKTMLRLAAERSHLRIVGDQRGSMTSAEDLARAVWVMAMRLADGHAQGGTFHFANEGELSWAELASEIFRLSAARGGPSASVEPIATSDYPTPARRPYNSRLDLSALKPAFDLAPRPWRDALSDIIAQLIPQT